MKEEKMFGGTYVKENLKIRLDEIKKEFNIIKNDKKFKEEYLYYLNYYVGRPSALYYARNLSEYVGGCKIYLKREDLNHTGSHKINNAIGQILLAKRLGKTNIIAETGAGSHGVATATVCAMFNMKCTIFMGIEDIKRQSDNVRRMKMLNAKVVPVTRGLGVLKDAVDYAFDYLMKHDDVYYLIGSSIGPEPYPEMVEYFQKIIGEEIRKQSIELEHKLPKALIACCGGGSNSIGMFSDFINEKSVDLYGIEAGGKGIKSGLHSSAFANKKVGIMHGMKTYIMDNDAYSISAGLDYPGIGPKHAYLYEINRVKYDVINDKEAVKAFKLLTKLEGIIPALESSHAIAYAIKISKKYSKDDFIVVNLSGRGDKDIDTVLNYK